MRGKMRLAAYGVLNVRHAHEPGVVVRRVAALRRQVVRRQRVEVDEPKSNGGVVRREILKVKRYV